MKVLGLERDGEEVGQCRDWRGRGWDDSIVGEEGIRCWLVSRIKVKEEKAVKVLRLRRKGK